MKFIMKIGDIATIPNIGDVVIGKNHEIEKDDISLLCKKGQEISLHWRQMNRMRWYRYFLSGTEN